MSFLGLIAAIMICTRMKHHWQDARDEMRANGGDVRRDRHRDAGSDARGDADTQRSDRKRHRHRHGTAFERRTGRAGAEMKKAAGPKAGGPLFTLRRGRS